MTDAIDAYRQDNDWLGQFLADHCDVAPEYTERSGLLYQTYRNACLLSGEYIRSTTDFYGSLDKAGFMRHRMSKGYIVAGLKLKDGQDFLE